LLDEIDRLKEIWNTISKHLTTTQIYILHDLINTKRKEWNENKTEDDEVFKKFCRNVIAMVQWEKKDGLYPWGKEEKPDKKWLDKWADYAVRGWIDDTIEIYMQILKEKPEEG
jgi:hypothetical protein